MTTRLTQKLPFFLDPDKVSDRRVLGAVTKNLLRKYGYDEKEKEKEAPESSGSVAVKDASGSAPRGAGRGAGMSMKEWNKLQRQAMMAEKRAAIKGGSAAQNTRSRRR